MYYITGGNVIDIFTIANQTDCSAQCCDGKLCKLEVTH